jgi:hypothetical protein
MKNKRTKKLALARETLRQLSRDRLQQARGGTLLEFIEGGLPPAISFEVICRFTDVCLEPVSAWEYACGPFEQR